MSSARHPADPNDPYPEKRWPVLCIICDGTGRDCDETGWIACEACGGVGELEDWR